MPKRKSTEEQSSIINENTQTTPVAEQNMDDSSTAGNNPVAQEEATEQRDTPKSDTESGKIMVDAEMLKSLLDRVDDLTKKQQEYEATATQDQIQRIEKLRGEGKLVKAVKLRTYGGKTIVGWKLIKDDVWVDANGKVHEDQVVKLMFDDGTTEDRPMVDFNRNTLYTEKLEVIKEAKTNTGETELTVMRSDGKETVILSKFVN